MTKMLRRALMAASLAAPAIARAQPGDWPKGRSGSWCPSRPAARPTR